MWLKNCKNQWWSNWILHLTLSLEGHLSIRDWILFYYQRLKCNSKKVNCKPAHHLTQTFSQACKKCSSISFLPLSVITDTQSANTETWNILHIIIQSKGKAKNSCWISAWKYKCWNSTVGEVPSPEWLPQVTLAPRLLWKGLWATLWLRVAHGTQ